MIVLTTFDSETQTVLLEAVREIQAMAGLAGRSREAYARKPVALGITSPGFGQGKTMLSMALAGSLSHDLGMDVILVDADFNTRSIELDYGIVRGDGLTEALRGAVQIDHIMHRLPDTSLSVVTAGMALGEAERVARSEQAAEIVRDMKERAPCVVFDLPATLHSTTATVLAGLCDGVIVLVKAGETTRAELDMTMRRLKDANVLGIVINRWHSDVPRLVEKSLALKM